TGTYDAEGRLQEFVPSNLVTGRGRIEGRPMVVIGDDFTVRGGANDGAVGDKLIAGEQMAHDLRVPLVRLVDGTGGGGSVKNIELKGHTLLPKLKAWPYITQNLMTVPVVGLGLGSVAGMGSARVAARHYSVMGRETSQLLVAGPPVAARAGQQLSQEVPGGSKVHKRNGAVEEAG